MSKKPLFIALLFVVMLSAVYAQEDFSASAQSTLTFCPCSGQAYVVTISNTGTVASTYEISVSENAKDWVRFSPATFSLNPQSSTRVTVIVNSPCSQQQSVPLMLTVATQNGLTKTISQTLQFKPCYGFTLTQGEPINDSTATSIAFSTHAGSYNMCAQDTAIIPLLITNTDTDFANAYTFTVQSGNANLPVSSINLNPSSSTVVLVHVFAQNAGESDVAIRATSQRGQLSATKGLTIEALDCYKLAVTLEPQRTQLCAGTTQQFPVRISNRGLYKQDIVLSSQGAPWANLDRQSVSLSPNRFSTRNLTLAPSQTVQGTYSLTLSAAIPNKQISAQDTLQVMVDPFRECFSADILANNALVQGESYLPIRIKNTGSQQETYALWLENIDWATLSAQKITLNPDEEYHATLHVHPTTKVPRGKYAVVIGIASPHISTKEEFTLKYAPEGPLAAAIKNFFYTYRYYLYAIVGVLILLFLFRKPLIKQYKQSRRLREMRKAREEKRRAAMESRDLKEQSHQQSKQDSSWNFPWTSMIILFSALIAGIAVALFPAALRSFFIMYGRLLITALILLAIITLILPKLRKWHRRRKK